MSFVKIIRKVVGIALIIFSIAFGFFSLFFAERETIIQYGLIYITTGILPLLLGDLILEGFKNLKLTIWPKLRLYTYFTFVIPMVINAADYLIVNKEKRVTSPSDLFLISDSEWSALIVIPAGIFAVIYSLPVFVSGWSNTEKFPRRMFTISTLICLTITLVTYNEYSAIRKEGLAFSGFFKEEIVPWSEVESAQLDGEVSKAGYSKNNSFNWTYTFVLSDGRIKEFRRLYLHESELETSNKINQRLSEAGVPLTVDPLSEDEIQFCQNKVDNDIIDADQFNSVFFAN
ncbi:hypothetical protein [Bacillus marasmi]|uniref:hypothetical protein n=1 Tax=Bacillus marasmi TaxID=1926279 RepID=UPI0011CB08AA|nr:hypothetical protein [Bacillus marasmi]